MQLPHDPDVLRHRPNRLPHVLSVQQAAALMQMTDGGLRGAIMRGKLQASKDGEGKIVIRSHDLAAFHLYGSSDVAEGEMRPGWRAALHRYLETIARE